VIAYYIVSEQPLTSGAKAPMTIVQRTAGLKSRPFKTMELFEMRHPGIL
jgi:hypothetical protein